MKKVNSFLNVLFIVGLVGGFLVFGVGFLSATTFSDVNALNKYIVQKNDQNDKSKNDNKNDNKNTPPEKGGGNNPDKPKGTQTVDPGDKAPVRPPKVA